MSPSTCHGGAPLRSAAIFSAKLILMVRGHADVPFADSPAHWRL